MKLDLRYCDYGIEELKKYQGEIDRVHNMIHQKTGEGSDYLGWLDLSKRLDDSMLKEIQDIANEIRENADVLVVCGIGGSYLGARSVIDALRSEFSNKPEIIYFGNSISSEQAREILDYIKDKSVYVHVISKSARTHETAVSFRILREYMEEKYKEEASRRIIATTDKSAGALRVLCDKLNYRNFVLDSDIGGRYSVFTPVGLLAISVAGFDIFQIKKTLEMAQEKYANPNIEENIAYQYALVRNLLYKDNKFVEVLVAYDPKLRYIGEWFKQLYGESEGKNEKGIFPASVINTTDLHSMGQYLQQGSRILFETTISFNRSNAEIVVPKLQEDVDGLNYAAGKTLDQVNEAAMLATILAHRADGVNNLRISMEKKDIATITELYYFFMKACAVSGYLLGINPFDQPGVEGYKDNMFALIGKPGTQDRRKELEKLL